MLGSIVLRIERKHGPIRGAFDCSATWRRSVCSSTKRPFVRHRNLSSAVEGGGLDIAIIAAFRIWAWKITDADWFGFSFPLNLE